MFCYVMVCQMSVVLALAASLTWFCQCTASNFFPANTGHTTAPALKEQNSLIMSYHAE